MANWDTVKSFLVSNYKCEPFGDSGLKLVFNIRDGRSQVVLVDWAGKSEESARWVSFASPIGSVDEVNLKAAATMAASYVLGGITVESGIAFVRTSVPLENLDRNEIVQPMEVLVDVADTIELQLTGGDVF